MCQYDEENLVPLPVQLTDDAKEHILVVQDKSIFHVNDCLRLVYLAEGQAVLRQKGNGRAIHVSDFLDEKSSTGRLCLSDAELETHDKLPADSKLNSTDARRIIYPGKNSDGWWDMKQLLQQVESAIKIFEYLHPRAIGVFTFDCSSAHEALSKDALNVNNMNIKSGGKQACLQDMIIPYDNPAPQHAGIQEMRGTVQKMCYPDNYHNVSLRGKPKGMAQVLQERKSIWEKLSNGGRKKVVGTCSKCQLSQKKREALL